MFLRATAFKNQNLGIKIENMETKYLHFQLFKSDPRWNVFRLAGVVGPCLRQRPGISVLIKTGPAAKLSS